MSVNPTGTGVEALRAVAARQRRERIHDVRRAARPVQAEINIVLRAPASTASSLPGNEEGPSAAGTAECGEIVHQTEGDGVGTAVCRSDIMEILAKGICGDVGQGNVRQQRLCR